MRERLRKAAKNVGYATTIVVAGWVVYAHFASSEETTTRSINTEKVVKELQAIHIKQNTAEEAKTLQTREYCLACLIKDKLECAKVGVEACEEDG